MAGTARDSSGDFLLEEALARMAGSLALSLEEVRVAARLEARNSEQRLQEALRSTEEKFQETLRECGQREVALSAEEDAANLPSTEGNRISRVEYEGLKQMVRELDVSIKAAVDRFFPRVEILLQKLEASSLPSSSTSSSSSAETVISLDIYPSSTSIHEPLSCSSYSTPPTRSSASTNAALAPSASPDSEAARGKALLQAAAKGQLEVVRTLLDEGVSVNYTNEYGCTPLHPAAGCRHVDIVHLLLERGANVNAVNCEGFAVLHLAAENDTTGQCVKALAAAGADLDIQDFHRNTPLHWAASQKRRKAAVALIAAGASKIIKNEDGLMPYQIDSVPFREILRP